jgi:hypothetical protein
MKYFNIKRYKFSTILNNVSKLSDILIRKLSDIFLKAINFKYIKKYNFNKILNHINITKINSLKNIKFSVLKKNDLNFIFKKYFLGNRVIFLHIPLAIIFLTFLYLFIPTFFKYDKLQITNLICNSKKIECKILGKISYNFYPSPRIKINNVKIKNIQEKRDLLNIEEVIIKLSIKNLLTKEKHNFKNMSLNNFKLNFDIKNYKKLQDAFNRNIYLNPLTFKKGQIVLFDKNDYISTIKNISAKLKFKKNNLEAKLYGNFLGKKINIKLKKEIIDNKSLVDFSLKIPDLHSLTKINFSLFEKNNHVDNGNFLFKMNKNTIAGIFNYKDDKLEIIKSNLRNIFIDGKLNGEIAFLPYFNFNLDLYLNSINFTKLYNHFLSLDIEKQKQILKINNKVNGFLNFSADKIYGKINLVKSIESRLKFYNGNIKFEQFLINLGKLGAADLVGLVENDDNKSHLKFESNIFVDNKKKFLSKFGIYNKEKINSNLFISGNFDLKNIRASIYEINDGENLKEADVNFIETEFNDIMLDDDFVNLFNFSKLKFFIKSILGEKIN